MRWCRQKNIVHVCVRTAIYLARRTRETNRMIRRVGIRGKTVKTLRGLLAMLLLILVVPSTSMDT